MVLVPSDRYQRAQTVKIKNQEPVIKMVTSVEQATEIAMAELKRVLDALKKKKNTLKKKPPTRQTLSKPHDDPLVIHGPTTFKPPSHRESE